MVCVRDHRKLRDATDARGLFDEFAESDQCEVRGCQYLQRSDRAAEDAYFKAQICRDSR
ncbi:hypothetical protein ALP29_201654 [Pseudomonas syringae pv. avii]|uniref:Uncharacterized protein n=1 Tax=Pseudomonas syringae pv. avii TaxID=663959 RepID=A0A3M5VNM0_PSESX|nr:hypothetical protein ALP29_201654 [Pseudomonas syringae pv. avii]